MRRREFLGAAAGALVAAETAAAQALPFPIIDTHIHLFDPTRPQGVPWPSKTDKVLYQPALPERYRRIAEPFGVAGAIEIECSPWLEDNRWVLDVEAKDKIMVGTIGDLEPGKPEFRAQLERFHRNPLFLGIRYGNLWGRNLASEIAKPAFIEDLRALAAAGLVLDTANQTPELIAATLRVTDAVPNLDCHRSSAAAGRAGGCESAGTGKETAGVCEGFRSAAASERPRAARTGGV